ncbi:protein-disulfide reductase DsbD family protein [Sphingobacterium spiritivorum]|uniref:Thiol:disulfide interchange protein DsbD N-terminal domain-containing protein n=1 Tax=Sphingobacterium spiritivorum ATCC 33861 TaxID=525373 RepID=D7VH33_SPHSI|nr:protein-disulfide reductase DsbD domain-containing protein [Sphingobacterium spiritivorum]EFK59385.1 hypothetical protein HMPREF0766_10302 [Sphingobacterium spiritivorum ATCC 33861]QQT33930.1 sugar transporter [Sphingobacterium spiritivorum]WQD34751.1 protein-disulfide reductase DsbD family protein [Sphingobacterium spiritivorum]SUI98254.1 Thiol:disulfide interchange protein [Sphingobacterium spiritivorum]
MKHLFFTLLAILFLGGVAEAQILNPVKWTYAAKKINDKEAVLYMKAQIDKGWHIYSQNMAEGGPVKTKFTFKPGKEYGLIGKTMEPKSIAKFEDTFKMTVNYFEKEVVFQQKIKLNSKSPVVQGTVEFMVCDDKQCLPPEEIEFKIAIK